MSFSSAEPALIGVLASSAPRASSTWLLELARYFLASLLALAADTACLSLLVEWGHWHYLAASASGFTLGTVLAFLLSTFWVFERHSFRHWSDGLLRFALIGVAGLLLNLLLMWLGTGVLGFPYLLSKASAAGGSFVFNFLVRRAMLFSDSRRVSA